MKSAVELNSLLLKLFCYAAWFDKRQNQRPCKGHTGKSGHGALVGP